MANRCYLYSTNSVPGSAAAEDRHVVGISEFGHDIPLGFKLLLSENPRPCSSLIFEGTDEIALVGDYEAGVSGCSGFSIGFGIRPFGPCGTKPKSSSNRRKTRIRILC